MNGHSNIRAPFDASAATIASAFEAAHQPGARIVAPAVVLKPTTLPRILLVDDDPVFCKVLARAATYFHASLTAVGKAGDLPTHELDRFDVAVIDYDLGAVTGLELARYVDDRSNLPIVLVSQSLRTPDRRWSDSIRDFVCKDSGPYAIIDAAFEAHEIALIHEGVRRGKRTTH